MRVTIFDYGAGNLHSLAKALESSGVDVRIETDPLRAVEGDALVLPGVGAFGMAADRLSEGRDAMRRAIAGGLPTIGICLGMQLLFDASDEGLGAGLGVIAGLSSVGRSLKEKDRPRAVCGLGTRTHRRQRAGHHVVRFANMRSR